MPDVFGILDDLVAAGKLKHYGVSVELVDDAIRAMRFERVQSVQIIFNMFRLKPAERFFAEAEKHRVGILARVPLASGLLTGKLTAQSQFAPSDHRSFNRNGEAFDLGETFSGVPLDVGFATVDELRSLVPSAATMAQLALRWILMHPAVTCAIPGGKTVRQIEDNVRAVDLPKLSDSTMARVQDVYDRNLRASIHGRW
jgi:Predicted oxidoreductases (related to aryl-alcohol dehydrogenases)